MVWKKPHFKFMKGFLPSRSFRGKAEKQEPASNLTNIYVGEWAFSDGYSSKEHSLSISINLKLAIDNRPLTGKIMDFTTNQLIFIDNFGYHIKIYTKDQHVDHFFDEADNRSYKLISLDSK